MTTGRRKILVVDDSPIELRLLSHLLGQAGFEPIIASSGAQALQLAQSDKPDLIVLDINMPLMDGYEVCRLLKLETATRDIPVILHSERDQVIDMIRGLEVGAETFSLKGGNKTDLLDRIRGAFPDQSGMMPVRPAVDLGNLREASDYKDAGTIAGLLSDAFTTIARQRINVILGHQTMMMLIERGMKVASLKYPIFTARGQFGDPGFPFDLPSVHETTARQVVEGFELFASELMRPLMRFAETGIIPARDVRGLDQAFKDCARLFIDDFRALKYRPATAAPEFVRPPANGRASDASLMPGPPPDAEHDPSDQIQFVADREQCISSIDAHSSRNLGFEPAALVGQPLSRILPQASCSLLGESLKGLTPADAVAGMAVQFRRSDGALLHVQLHSDALYDGQGRFMMSRHTGRILSNDAVARILMEETRGKLEQAQSALAMKSRALRGFLEHVSHDFKQPLQVVMNLSQLIEEEYGSHLDDTGREYVATIQVYAQRMREMIGDITTLARIFEEDLVCVPTDLGELIAGVLVNLSDLLEERGAVVVPDRNLPSVRCDPAKLRLVFLNLIENAVKFDEGVEPRVLIKASRDEAGITTVSVRDSGRGIEEKDFEKIFGIFQRLHSPDAYKGRGAGLALCRAIVEAHGGRIWLDSTPGVGTTFHFTLAVP